MLMLLNKAITAESTEYIETGKACRKGYAL
jgi:hypothetical protein